MVLPLPAPPDPSSAWSQTWFPDQLCEKIYVSLIFKKLYLNLTVFVMFKGKGITNLASTTWAQFRSVPRGSFLHLEDTQQILDHTQWDHLDTGGHEPTLGLLKYKAEHT